MHWEVMARHRDDNESILGHTKLKKKLFFLETNILDRVPPM